MERVLGLVSVIKGCIWELKESNTPITVKSVYDAANGEISFNDLPQILEYLQSIKHKFLFTECRGYLELTPFGKAKVSDLISKD